MLPPPPSGLVKIRSHNRGWHYNEIPDQSRAVLNPKRQAKCVFCCLFFVLRSEGGHVSATDTMVRLFFKGYCLLVAFCLVGCATTPLQGSRSLTLSQKPLWQLAENAAKEAEASPSKIEKARHAQYGMQAGDQCIMQHPEEAACYYYKAINTGLYYEAHIIGYQDGLRSMVADLKKVVALSDHFDYGGGYRILAQIYAQAPQWGGSDDITQHFDLAETYLLKAIETAPDYPANYVELSTLHVAQNKPKKAMDSLSTASKLIPYWRSQPDYNQWVRLCNELKKKLKTNP